MRISIITLFPEMFSGVFDTSIIKRARQKNKLEITLVNLRDFSTDTYSSVDDHPYGGGAGMVLRVDVIDRALTAVKATSADSTHVILMTPQGTPYSQKKARELTSSKDHLIVLCGHYEGFDERVRSLVDEEISIGDYILTGGEIPAMVLTDSVARLIPGVLADPNATLDESFEKQVLEYPQYTRPETYKSLSVPPVLLSGNHAVIKKWREGESLLRTKKRRPDLLKVKKGSPLRVR